jgi:hypothetical protein
LSQAQQKQQDEWLQAGPEGGEAKPSVEVTVAPVPGGVLLPMGEAATIEEALRETHARLDEVGVCALKSVLCVDV